MAVTMTTSMGLKRSAKPAMMMSTPISGHRFTSTGMEASGNHALIRCAAGSTKDGNAIGNPAQLF
ncbi:hypothetical protein CTTA_1505 [Comamonas testosteroni]|uniref:Uncharacterized protein n=1 Tax=Comamonas testosteroni TaxID=285 RepID=A0A5A7MAA2_COMTE|nr:hypothetical protein CTTA_1505 [Comamonas testosteroni]